MNYRVVSTVELERISLGGTNVIGETRRDGGREGEERGGRRRFAEHDAYFDPDLADEEEKTREKI